MQIQTDNREVVTGYVLISMAIINIVLVQMRPIDMTDWLIFTTTATAAMIASRLAREASFGPGIQALVKETPLWKIFGLGIGVVVAIGIFAGQISAPGWSVAIRKVFSPIGFGIIVIGIEIAISRWATGFIRDRIAVEQA